MIFRQRYKQETTYQHLAGLFWNMQNIKTLIILANGPVDKPLKVYDGYDARSEIENSMFREAKQAWYIQ